jgi:hypothetical protein
MFCRTEARIAGSAVSQYRWCDGLSEEHIVIIALAMGA